MKVTPILDAPSRTRISSVAMFAIFAIALLVMPLILYPIFLIKLLCYALLAASINLLLGYGGMLSFGHAAFFGMGSYIAAYVAKTWGWSPLLSLPLATAVAALLGLAVGTLAIRRQGIYFAMITLAVSQMIYFFCAQASFTGGEDGIQDVPRGTLFGSIDLASNLSIYYFVATVCFIGFLCVFRIIHSPFGNVISASRQNDARAVSLGFATKQHKLLLFVLSAAIAGLAGGLKAIAFGLATLADVHWTMSGEVVLIALLGGLGCFWGPLAGAIVIVTMETYLGKIGSWITVVQGAIFVACVLAFKRGIVGELMRKFAPEN